MWDFLTATNPWWDGEKVPAQMLGKTRSGYLDKMEKNLRSLNTLIITGPRRTGKTTLIRQFIQRLLDSGISPRSILYLQLDHPSMPKENAILEALKELRKEFALARREKIHLFLDEAQYARDWARQVKVLCEKIGRAHV